jgi:transposase
MSVPEFAKRFGVDQSTVNRWIKVNHIKAERRPVRVGLRKTQYFIPETEAERLESGG